MLRGAEVKAYFDEHPKAREIVENTEAQFKCWRPGLSHEDMYRLLTVDDIMYISFEGWEGQPGVFAWYYPGGVPHYMSIEEEGGDEEC